jgi:hypothetical protein
VNAFYKSRSSVVCNKPTKHQAIFFLKVAGGDWQVKLEAPKTAPTKQLWQTSA